MTFPESQSESEKHSVMSDSLQPRGILQARILEWVAYPFSRGSSWPRNQTRVSCIAGRFFTNIREAPKGTLKQLLITEGKECGDREELSKTNSADLGQGPGSTWRDTHNSIFDFF